MEATAAQQGQNIRVVILMHRLVAAVALDIMAVAEVDIIIMVLVVAVALLLQLILLPL